MLHIFSWKLFHLKTLDIVFPFTSTSAFPYLAPIHTLPISSTSFPFLFSSLLFPYMSPFPPTSFHSTPHPNPTISISGHLPIHSLSLPSPLPFPFTYHSPPLPPQFSTLLTIFHSFSHPLPSSFPTFDAHLLFSLIVLSTSPFSHSSLPTSYPIPTFHSSSNSSLSSTSKTNVTGFLQVFEPIKYCLSLPGVTEVKDDRLRRDVTKASSRRCVKLLMDSS